MSAFEAALRALHDELWPPYFVQEANSRILPGHGPAWRILNDPAQRLHAPLLASVERLHRQFGERLGALAAEMYFEPLSWMPRYTGSDLPLRGLELATYRNVFYLVMSACLVQHPPPDLVARIEARLRRQFEFPYDRSESPSFQGYSYPPHYYLSPDIIPCLDLLVALPPSPASFDLAERLLRGALNFGPMPEQGMLANRPMRMVYEIHNVGHLFHKLLQYLWRSERLTYEIFREAALQQASVIANHDHPHHWLPGFSAEEYAVFKKIADAFKTRLTDEVTRDLNEAFARIVNYSGLTLSGPEMLLRAAENHARSGLKGLVNKSSFEDELQAALVRLARAKDVEPSDPQERAEVVGRLKTFPEATLTALLPVAPDARRMLTEALGWQDALPLLDQIFAISGQPFDTGGYSHGDAPNSTDPASGVVEREAVRAAAAQAGEKRAKEILKMFRSAKVGADNTTMLIEAAMGWNRDKVLASFAKHTQIAIKAFGLLPLERGGEEALERYLALRQSAKDGRKFGAQRRGNHAAAVQVALSNLAQTAGYAGAARFEWAMEGRVAEEVAPAGRTWPVGDYEVALLVDGADAAVEIRKAGKTLKSVPAAVRKTPEYKEARAAVDGLRGQASRLRSEVLEPMLASGEALTPDDLRGFLRLPAARAMLEKLILCLESGVFGLLDADKLAARDLDGQDHPIAAPVILAHPFHLFEAEQLGAWQREIVRRRMVQPFKQAFRELYVLTPAERETRTYSNRFAGHSIDSAVATKLFGARGWRIETGDNALPYRLFRGLRAEFRIVEALHFLGEVNPITTDQVCFMPLPLPNRWWQQGDEGRLALEGIPPLIFSEVMRDADLIVSVAQRGDSSSLVSGEIIGRRSDLLRALIDDLGLPGVRVDGHFAYVKGKLAQYRVHLGSAVIHIEPGQYLCIVPDRWGKTHEKLFLPFADTNDAKTSEVISKILLLLADDKIKDESILRQIRHGA